MSEVKKVITASDRSAKGVVKAVADLSKVAVELTALAQSNVNLAEEIEFKQSQLADLDNQINTKEREGAAQLRLRVIENEDRVLADLMKARGLATISVVDLNQLNTRAVNAEAGNEQAVEEARNSAFRQAESASKAQIAQLQGDHRVEMAELNANSKAKDNRIEFLEAQVTQLQGEVKAERDTRLEIAKAESNRQGVTVNTGKN